MSTTFASLSSILKRAERNLNNLETYVEDWFMNRFNLPPCSELYQDQPFAYWHELFLREKLRERDSLFNNTDEVSIKRRMNLDKFINMHKSPMDAKEKSIVDRWIEEVESTGSFTY